MKNYTDVEIISTEAVKSGEIHLDKFFSTEGGIEWSNLIFLTGTSGAGKTTLCKKLQSLISNHVSAFYSREMLSGLVKKQTLRLDIKHANAFISDSKDYPHFNQFMEMIESRGDVKILILDSIQRIAVDFVKEGMGRDAAMRHMYNVLTEWKDRTGGIVILIGQLTKDGDFEGASFLKFDADAHVHMVYDKKRNIRTIETTKNRMGKTDKLYYEILDSSETLKFYTEKEFELNGKNYKFDDYLLKMVGDFLSNIDKKNPHYNEFKEEYNSKWDNINKEGGMLEVTIEIARLIDELSRKYEL